MAHEPVACTIKSPVTLQVGDVRTELGRPGVVVMDVAFPHYQIIDVSMEKENKEKKGSMNVYSVLCLQPCCGF